MIGHCSYLLSSVCEPLNGFISVGSIRLIIPSDLLE